MNLLTEHARELRLLAKRINDGQVAVSPSPTFEGK